MTRFLRSFLFISLALILGGWGNTGHKIINMKIVSSFPVEMSQFLYWKQTLENYASAADNRKSSDPTEAPKHFIDIDNYPEFIDSGWIDQNYDSLVFKYGSNFVLKQGVLPWAAITAFDSLRENLIRKDWDKAGIIAADLGHYMGDAHMPLHLTNNYNGLFTGQTGIHSRFESTMINRYSAGIIYNSDTAKFIEDVSDYIFQTIYANYPYLDSLLAADLKAKADADGQYDDLYYQKMWEYSKDFTTELFRNATTAIANLIYTAWVNAGKPLETPAVISEEMKPVSFSLEQNYPNPFNPSTSISFSLAYPGEVSISIYNFTGELVAIPVKDFYSPGTYTFTFNAEDLTSGIYFCTAQSGSSVIMRKMLLLK
jgi:hypothetical protein